MCQPPSSDGGPVVSYTRHPVGNCVSVAPHVCFLTGAPRRRRPDRCEPFHVCIPPRRRPIVQRCPTGGGEAVIPRPARRPRADGRCTSPVALPPTGLSAQLPAMLIVRRWDGVPSSAGTAPGPADDRPSTLRAPAGDPTPITQVQVRTRAKSITGFSLSKPVSGFPVPV